MHALSKICLLGSQIHELEMLFPNAVLRNVSLSEISRWGVGGAVDILVLPRSLDDIVRLRRWLIRNSAPSLVIGATSNLLFSDNGLRSVCVQIGESFAGIAVDGNQIVADAGVWVPKLARVAMQHDLSGIEHISGIPGTLGGLVCMNGGSQRKGIGEVVTQVTSVDSEGHVHVRTRDECDFSYRKSVFQKNNETIAKVSLELERNNSRDSTTIRREMLEILKGRRKKFPRKLPNCGSVFVSNPEMYSEFGPPGVVIESVGLKGYSIGGAQVSTNHANFIVNTGSAKASDILELISVVKEKVKKDVGYLMDVEVRYINERGDCVVL